VSDPSAPDRAVPDGSCPGHGRCPRIEARNRRWFPRYRPSTHVYLNYARQHAGAGDVVLHVGASRDSLGVGARLGDCRLVSVDLDPAGLAGNPNPRRVMADVECLPLADASCQLALFDNVFEHLVRPETALRETHRVLSNGGRLIFVCPNRLGYVALVGAVTPHRFHVWVRRLVSPAAQADTFETYYRLNTPRAVRRLARATGFVTEWLESYVGWPSYWEFSDLLHRVAVALHWLIERGPRTFHISLVGVLRKDAASQR
jgi:SAM-dependent methyltransferase